MAGERSSFRPRCQQFLPEPSRPTDSRLQTPLRLLILAFPRRSMIAELNFGGIARNFTRRTRFVVVERLRAQVAELADALG